MSEMQLKPILGPIQLIFYCVGVIVGAVYSVIGTAAGLAQESLWLSFSIAALVALLTGFSYAEMLTRFRMPGRHTFISGVRFQTRRFLWGKLPPQFPAYKSGRLRFSEFLRAL